MKKFFKKFIDVKKNFFIVFNWVLGKYYTRMGVGVIRYYNPDTGVTRKFYTVDFVRY